MIRIIIYSFFLLLSVPKQIFASDQKMSAIDHPESISAKEICCPYSDGDHHAHNRRSVIVRKLQKALIKKGARIRADGIYGPNTHKALSDFQRAYKLTPTGNLDSATKKALGL